MGNSNCRHWGNIIVAGHNAAGRAHFAAYQGAVRSLDSAIGRILAAVEAAGLAENTIIVYTTDHGVDLGQKSSYGYEAFRRAKHSLYDLGLEIAGIIRAPGHLAAGSRTETLASNIDILPTLLDLMGIEAPDNLDGESLLPYLGGEAGPKEAVFGTFTGNSGMGVHDPRSIRTCDYKLIFNFCYGREHKAPVDLSGGGIRQFIPVVQLFDIRNDPAELHDRADDPEFQPVLESLRARLFAWLQETHDPILRGPTAPPIYHEAMARLRGRIIETGIL